MSGPETDDRLDWLRQAVEKCWRSTPELAAELVEREAPSLPPGPARDELLALTLDPLIMAGRLAEAKQRAGLLLASASAWARMEALSAVRLCAELEGRWEDALAAALAVVESPQAGLEAKANLLGSVAFEQLALGRLADAQRSADDALAAGTLAQAPGAVSAALRTRSWLRLARGDIDAALEDAEAAVAAAGHLPKNRLPELALGLALAAGDRLDEAERVLAAGRRACEERGWRTAVPYYRGPAAVVDYLLGRVPAEPLGSPLPAPAAGLGLLELAVAARRRLHLGHVGGARELVAAARTVPPSLWTAGWLEWVELLVAEATGADVLAPAETAAAGILQAELLGPWTIAAPDVVRLASPDTQRVLLDFVERGSDRVRTASGSACALHCAALVHGDWRRAAGAAERLADAGRPLAQARALEDAAALAAAPRGRALLLDAARTYSRCGARADAERCSAGVAGAAVPLTGLHLLTPAEHRVVALVADGLSNAEVAARLHLSPRTVQAHLSSVFLKLGVRSRAMVTARVVGARSRQPDS